MLTSPIELGSQPTCLFITPYHSPSLAPPKDRGELTCNLCQQSGLWRARFLVVNILGLVHG